jgi:hypothetical protein
MFGFTELTNFCCESYVTMVTKLALQVVFFFFVLLTTELVQPNEGLLTEMMTSNKIALLIDQR